jgi:hypothetical protein
MFCIGYSHSRPPISAERFFQAESARSRRKRTTTSIAIRAQKPSNPTFTDFSPLYTGKIGLSAPAGIDEVRLPVFSWELSNPHLRLGEIAMEAFLDRVVRSENTKSPEEAWCECGPTLVCVHAAAYACPACCHVFYAWLLDHEWAFSNSGCPLKAAIISIIVIFNCLLTEHMPFIPNPCHTLLPNLYCPAEFYQAISNICRHLVLKIV